MKENIEKINQIQEIVMKELKEIKTLDDCNNLRIKYLSKKGEISELSSIMSSLDIEEKKQFGQLLNDLKR